MSQMVIDMRKKWLWTNSTIISLGVWLISSPSAFGLVIALSLPRGKVREHYATWDRLII